jgi:hypothetical protein
VIMFSAHAAAAAAVDLTTPRLPQAFPYCPNWALSWGSRRRRILRDISNAKCDIIALQVKFAPSKRDLQSVVCMISLQLVSKIKPQNLNISLAGSSERPLEAGATMICGKKHHFPARIIPLPSGSCPPSRPWATTQSTPKKRAKQWGRKGKWTAAPSAGGRTSYFSERAGWCRSTPRRCSWRSSCLSELHDRAYPTGLLSWRARWLTGAVAQIRSEPAAAWMQRWTGGHAGIQARCESFALSSHVFYHPFCVHFSAHHPPPSSPQSPPNFSYISSHAIADERVLQPTRDFCCATTHIFSRAEAHGIKLWQVSGV